MADDGKAKGEQRATDTCLDCRECFFDEELEAHQCKLYHVVSGFDPITDRPTDCPGDKDSEHVVMTNVPGGVTNGVSWRVVSEHSDWEEAAREAMRLNNEAHTIDDQGRVWWSGYSYVATHPVYISDCRAGNLDPPEFFDTQDLECEPQLGLIDSGGVSIIVDTVEEAIEIIQTYDVDDASLGEAMGQAIEKTWTPWDDEDEDKISELNMYIAELNEEVRCLCDQEDAEWRAFDWSVQTAQRGI